MDRGRIGTMPAATERDDESYLDFVEGLRVHTGRRVRPAVLERAVLAEQEHERTVGRIQQIGDLRRALDPVPLVAARNRLMRSSQEMMWSGVIDTYRKRETELLAELDRSDRSGPGSVQWDPSFVFPEYFDRVEFHIQPGSYHRDPLAGYIYHYGTKVFSGGTNNNDDNQRGLIARTPVPTDGQVRRILDLACSIGQGTTAFKERFSNAEVCGIDAGAPMVRYAHKRAAEMGLDVHFKQALAENTGFSSGTFDLVHAFILFHEIPTNIADRVVAEAHRLLRPGGLFVVVDFANRTPGSRPVWDDYARDFDAKENGEPYSSEFVYSNFLGLLRRHFQQVREEIQGNYQSVRIATR